MTTRCSFPRHCQGSQRTAVLYDNAGSWVIARTTGSRARHGFTARHFQVSSTFDPEPLQRILADNKLGNLRIDIEEVTQGATVARCDGAAPTDAQSIGSRNADLETNSYFECRPVVDSASSTARQPLPKLHFLVGFSDAETWARLSLPVLILLIPFAALIVFVRYILTMAAKVAGVDPTNVNDVRAGEQSVSERRNSIWFGFNVYLQNGAACVSYLWIFVAFALRPASLLLWKIHPSTNELRVELAALLYLLPPIATLTAADLLTRPVYRALNGRTISVREMTVSSASRLFAAYLPFTLVAVALAAATDGFFRVLHLPTDEAFVLIQQTSTYRFIGWILAIQVVLGAINLLTYFTGGTKTVIVEEGELYRRVMKLAAQAGVKIRGVQFMATGNFRTANAFALQHETVMFTDCLVNELSRGEVDAIIAHELAHVKRKHLGKRLRPIGFASGLILAGIVIAAVAPAFFDAVGNSRVYQFIVLAVLPLATLVAPGWA